MELYFGLNARSAYRKKQFAIAFYEFDALFDGVNGIYNLLKYGNTKTVNELIAELGEFAFVICPDYSVYGNFPVYKQMEAIAKSREVGSILQSQGLKVIVNYRASLPWSYEMAISGLSKHQTVAVGTLGALGDKETRKMLKAGIRILAQCIQPKIVIVYGSAPNDVFEPVTSCGGVIWQFDSRIATAFNKKGGCRHGAEK